MPQFAAGMWCLLLACHTWRRYLFQEGKRRESYERVEDIVKDGTSGKFDRTDAVGTSLTVVCMFLMDFAFANTTLFEFRVRVHPVVREKD